MKLNKYITLFLITFCFCEGLNAQVYVIRDNDILKKSSYTVTSEIVDSLTNDPIQFASVYLHHPNDTLITNFSLSDLEGKVELTEVTTGEHTFVVEYMGYLPYVKQFFIRDDSDLGKILLKPDPNYLDAASVTAAVNPVEFRKDTIIYNAAAFKVMQGSSLGDLLKQMPGVEINDNGDVRVNGTSVSRITIGGKTFFMGDNSVALNNVPASIVDKVKVIDKESRSAQFSGVKELEKEKEMDVELKEEYKSGYFGNVKLGLGSSIPSKNQNEHLENKFPIFDASAMVSAYGEQDQVTAVAGASNAPSTSTISFMGNHEAPDVFYDAPAYESSAMTTSWNAGVNVNSNRIKGFTTDGSIFWSGANQALKTQSSTITSLEDYNMDTEETVQGTTNREDLIAKVVMEKEVEQKYYIYFQPHFKFTHLERNYTNNDEVYGDALINTSTANNWSKSNSVLGSTDFEFGTMDLGKEGRSLIFQSATGIGGGSGNSTEYSVINYAKDGTSSIKDLYYDGSVSTLNGSANLQYVEPLSERWALSLEGNVSRSKSTNEKNAFNSYDGAANDYYSSYSDNLYRTRLLNAMAQYNMEETTISGGLSAQWINSETQSRAYGMDTRTGEGEWLRSVSPYAWITSTIDGYLIKGSLKSEAHTPSSFQLTPAFNLLNPTRIGLGNIYLNPYFSHNIMVQISKTIPKKNITFAAVTTHEISRNSIVNASWFDSNGVLYYIPVNTKGLSRNHYFNYMFNAPLSKDKRLRFYLKGDITQQVNNSYQSEGTLAGIDTDNFDYTDFMKTFWGDKTGNVFYSEESGFKQSVTKYTTISNTFRLSRRFDNWSLTGYYKFYNHRSSWSLNEAANTNIWRNTFRGDIIYTTPHDFELGTIFEYTAVSGYQDGYNIPKYEWDCSIRKSYKSFIFSFDVYNILNQHSLRKHSVAENYVKDVFVNSLGRCAIFSVKYNFGKSDASKASTARSAQINMMH